MRHEHTRCGWGVGLALAVSLTGCGDDASLSQGGGGDLLVATEAPEVVITGTDASPLGDIAAQMARDAEFIEQFRQGEVPPANDVQAESLPPTPREVARRPEVDWGIGPSMQGSSASRDRTGLGMSSGLGMDEPEFEPSDWFRDPDEVRSSPDPVPSETTVVASSGLSSMPADDLNAVMIEFTRLMYQDSTYSAMPIKELMAIAAMTVVDPDRALDPEMLENLTARERELFSQFQTFFLDLGRSLEGDVDSEQVLVEAVQDLRNRLVVEPALSIPTVAMCTRVVNFGKYDEIEPRRFLANGNSQFALYVELENFVSELSKDEEWVTEISLEVRIYADRDGVLAAKDDWQLAVDVAKHKRSDFYIAHLVELPNSLGVGKYNLKVRVRDERSGSIAESGLDFTLVADRDLLSGE